MGLSFKHNVLVFFIFLGAGCLGDQVGVLPPSPLVMTRCMLRLGKASRSIQLVHKKNAAPVDCVVAWCLCCCWARVKLWDIFGLGIPCVTRVDTWNSACRGRATSQPGLSQSDMCVGRLVLCCRVFGERSGFCAPVVFPLSLMAPADGPEGCDPVYRDV